jgi:hypothetical protein
MNITTINTSHKTPKQTMAINTNVTMMKTMATTVLISEVDVRHARVPHIIWIVSTTTGMTAEMRLLEEGRFIQRL